MLSQLHFLTLFHRRFATSYIQTSLLFYSTLRTHEFNEDRRNNCTIGGVPTIFNFAQRNLCLPTFFVNLNTEIRWKKPLSQYVVNANGMMWTYNMDIWRLFNLKEIRFSDQPNECKHFKTNKKEISYHQNGHSNL